jgi:hypothetical protein
MRPIWSKNPFRTNVKAALSQEGTWDGDGYANPGECWATHRVDGTQHGLAIACPGCGVVHSVAVGVQLSLRETWTVVAGDLRDVTTLSLSPSLTFSCCGWMGWLKQGIFIVPNED